jgi:hypothetical protein
MGPVLGNVAAACQGMLRGRGLRCAPREGSGRFAGRRLMLAAAAAIAAGLISALGAGAADASPLANPFAQQGEELSSAEMTADAAQGYSVAVSADGSTAIVGAPHYDGFAGAAWVYVRSGSTWSAQQKLVSSEGSSLAEQGFSVAISADGNTVLVGGPEDAGPKEEFYGAVWVFTRSGSAWTQQQKLVATGSGATTKSAEGESVALSAEGNTALIGAYDNEAGVGAAWVYVLEGGKWVQQGGRLVGGEHGTAIAQQGTSVALSADGNTALVGGPRAEGAKDENEVGAAWVFTRTGSTWSEQAKLPRGTGVGEDAAQGQGVALSGDGDTAVAGAPGLGTAGGAFVYTRSGSTWTQQGEPLLGEDAVAGAQQGRSVALSEDGNTALVGGYRNNISQGAAWAFQRVGSAWSEQQKLVGTGGESFGEQGFGVALSADASTAVVGAPGSGSGVGGAWVFVRSQEATCAANRGTVTISPGLTDTAAFQTMTIKGTLTGCTDESFTKASYTATLKTAGAVSCSVLTGAGETATGVDKYKWTPKTKTASTGTLSMPLTETPDAPFSAEVTAGSYTPLTFTGTATESYTGAAKCGEKVGTKPAKPVKKGTFIGSVVSIG